MKTTRAPAGVLLLGILVGLGGSVRADVPPGRLWTYQYLLVTSNTERELAPITEHIVHDPDLQEPEIGDFAAQVLLTRYDDPGYPWKNKLRLIRVIAAMQSKRYDTVLALLEAKTPADDDEARKELKIARKKARNAADAYVPGTVDIQAIVREMDAAALAAQPTTEQGRHLAEFKGETIDELFAWAGKPQQIASGQTRVSDGLLVQVKIQRLAFFYRGLGRVVFRYDTGPSDKGWLFNEVVADPLAFEQEMPYRAHPQDHGQPDEAHLEMIQLLSNDTEAMRKALELNNMRGARPIEFMDTAAEILATQFKSAVDPAKVDAYAWICRLLAEHGGPRYAAILQRVAAEASDSKLRRHAEQKIEPTAEYSAEPYVPGTISLDAQRARYPSLYPESTFQNNRGK